MNLKLTVKRETKGETTTCTVSIPPIVTVVLYLLLRHVGVFIFWP